MGKFKFGDLVRVHTKIGNERDGFCWVDDMDGALGKIGKVIDVSAVADTRYRLEFDGYKGPSGYWYKEASLALACELPNNEAPVPQVEVIHNTITLRDHFAMHAPPPPDWFPKKQVNKEGEVKYFERSEDWFFRWRYHYADKMMKAREV
jgi:hypothetical protein